jgi:ubiquinone/menaquinone biosynthesis C-methylase UbiE
VEPLPDAAPALDPRPAGLRARLPLATRRDDAELLDTGTLTPAEVAANLGDLARLNRLPGGTDASIAAIRALAPDSTALTVLDAGAGGADMAVRFARRGWATVAVDHHPDVLAVARSAVAGTTVEVIEADALALPFPDGAVDVAHASLLLHHLDPGAAVRLLVELRRVARRGVVINDLRRGLVPFVATMAPLLVLARSGVTRHDGAASARRAYTLDEIDRLLDRAGLAVHWRSSQWLPRVATAAVRA